MQLLSKFDFVKFSRWVSVGTLVGWLSNCCCSGFFGICIAAGGAFFFFFFFWCGNKIRVVVVEEGACFKISRIKNLVGYYCKVFR